MTLCERVGLVRSCGAVRCRVLPTPPFDLSSSVAAANDTAREIGLRQLGDAWRQIERAEARSILVEVLHRDLAYGEEIMQRAIAEGLASEFIDAFPPPAHFFTNLEKIRPNAATTTSRGWTPATAATFDCGVLAVGSARRGALWVEDED